MTDYEEEQEMELEALEAIFMDEFIPDESNPSTVFKVIINDVECINRPITIDFKYTATYPDAPPTFHIQPTIALTPDQTTRVKEQMDKAAEEELGTVMVFTMVQAAKDWLNDNFAEPLEEEASTEEKAVLPQELRGTPVTLENFLEWNKLFMVDKVDDVTELPRAHPGPTGRQLFEGGYVAEPEPDKEAEAAAAQEAEIGKLGVSELQEAVGDVGVLDEGLWDDEATSDDDSDDSD